MRRKALAFTAAVGLLGLPGLANAVPGAPSPAATGVATSPGLLQVRDGCGPGSACRAKAGQMGALVSAMRAVPRPPSRSLGRPAWGPGSVGMVLTGDPVGVTTTASRRQPTGYAGRQSAGRLRGEQRCGHAGPASPDKLSRLAFQNRSAAPMARSIQLSHEGNMPERRRRPETADPGAGSRRASRPAPIWSSGISSRAGPTGCRWCRRPARRSMRWSRRSAASRSSSSAACRRATAA